MTPKQKPSLGDKIAARLDKPAFDPTPVKAPEKIVLHRGGWRPVTPGYAGLPYDETLYVRDDVAEQDRRERDALWMALEGLMELLEIREASDTMPPLCQMEEDRLADARAAIAKCQSESD